MSKLTNSRSPGRTLASAFSGPNWLPEVRRTLDRASAPPGFGGWAGCWPAVRAARKDIAVNIAGVSEVRNSVLGVPDSSSVLLWRPAGPAARGESGTTAPPPRDRHAPTAAAGFFPHPGPADLIRGGGGLSWGGGTRERSASG